MRFAATLVLAVAAVTVSGATFNCDASRNCCMKNHSTCTKQREGGVDACDEPESVYCGSCGADCCTYDPSAATYVDAQGSLWTSSSTLTGTYCKS